MKTPIFNQMAEYGSNIVPLSLVGIFMNCVGNHLLNYIYQTFKLKVFHPYHKVIGIHQLANGEFLTTAVRRVQVIQKNDQGEMSLIEQDQNIVFRSRAVVVSNGGKQSIHPSFYKKWFPFMKQKKDRVILSDKFMRRDIYL